MLDTHHMIIAAALSFLLYTQIEKAISVFRKAYPKVFKDAWYQENLMLSSIHATFQIIGSSLFLNQWISSDVYIPYHALVTIGYYVKDLIFVYRYDQYSTKIKSQYFVHHTVCLMISYFGGKYPLILARGFLVELTIPLTNWCMYLKTIDQTNTIMYKASFIIMSLFYFMVRIVYAGIYVMGPLMYSDHYWVIIFGTFLYVLNFSWMFTIIKKIRMLY